MKFFNSISLLLSLAVNTASAQLAIPDELDLDTALQFALENNFTIRQAQERIAKQEHFIVQVRAAVLPKVDLNYHYSIVDPDRLEDFGGSSFGSDQDWSVSVELKQPLYSGGRGTARLTEEKKRLQAAELEIKAIIQEQLLRVRTYFFDILLAREKITVQKQSLALLEAQLKTVQERFEAGAVPRFELIRAQVALANGRPPLIRAKNDYRIAWEELREAVGYTGDTRNEANKVPAIIGDLSYQPERFGLFPALIAARANRVELKRYALLYEAARKAVRAEQARYAPNLDLVLGYQVKKSNFNNAIDETIDGWAVGVQGSWSIFDSWATQAQVAQARSDLNQTLLGGDETKLQIEVEVRRAFSTWLEAEELVKASELVVEQAAESVRLADERYRVGAATHLDVLAAQVELTEAKTNQVEALHRHNIAVATLRKAMGVGVRF